MVCVILFAFLSAFLNSLSALSGLAVPFPDAALAAGVRASAARKDLPKVNGATGGGYGLPSSALFWSGSQPKALRPLHWFRV